MIREGLSTTCMDPFNTFHPHLIESVDAEAMDMEGCMPLGSECTNRLGQLAVEDPADVAGTVQRRHSGVPPVAFMTSSKMCMFSSRCQAEAKPRESPTKGAFFAHYCSCRMNFKIWQCISFYYLIHMLVSDFIGFVTYPSMSFGSFIR